MSNISATTLLMYRARFCFGIIPQWLPEQPGTGAPGVPSRRSAAAAPRVARVQPRELPQQILRPRIQVPGGHDLDRHELITLPAALEVGPAPLGPSSPVIAPSGASRSAAATATTTRARLTRPREY